MTDKLATPEQQLSVSRRSVLRGAIALSAGATAFGAGLLRSTSALAQTAVIRSIGEVTALIPEASTAGDTAAYLVDGQSGNTNFPFVSNMKPIATIGEVDAETGMALTGYPDGHAALLADNDTIRVIYQSESYGTMSNETYPQVMNSGATFTGSHIHTIDYDRAAFADFLSNDTAASEMVRGSGHLYNTIFNVFGEEVVPAAEGGKWGNQTLADGTVIPFAPTRALSEADFFAQSFCGAYYEQANKYGDGIGFADDVWLTAEEWNIQRMFNVTNAAGDTVGQMVDAHDTMGLASVVVDIANETAYTVPALGQTGYEKLLPINPGHPDYVVLVAAGYNHDVEPAPLKIYVGRKGLDAAGNPVGADASARDQFLARNGLLNGRLYGLALANDAFAGLGIDSPSLEDKMMDAYLTNADAPDAFDAVFAPTSYQWAGWDANVSVRDTEMLKWQDEAEQPAGHMFFVGDSKTEHPAVDPNTANTRWVQNMTQEGGILGFDLPNLADELAAAEGGLPATVTTRVTRTLAAVDGALTLNVGDAGIKHGGAGTHATWEDGSAKAVAPDGLMWVKASDADVLIVDEDSGNDYGERKYALMLNADTLMVEPAASGYFLAMAGGSENPRAAAGVEAYAGTSSRATSSEFSGTWPVTALVARKGDGSFYSQEELSGTGIQDIMGSMSINDQTFIGVVQHRSGSGGAVAETNADAGGQLFMFSLNLPV